MGKSPRKQAVTMKSTRKHIGGKNFAGIPATRRFSIADSDDDDEDEDDDDKEAGDSDSSLTVVSEDGGAGTSNKGKSNLEWFKRSGGSGGYNEDDDAEDDEEVGIEDLYSMLKGGSGAGDSALTSDLEDDDEDEDNGDDDDDGAEEDNDSNEYSSSDDSDVDFVKLQAERKKKSMKAVRAFKGIRSQQPKPKLRLLVSSDLDQDDSDTMVSSRKSVGHKKVSSKRRKSSVAVQKIGRRKSEVALPEDINFKFEFDDIPSNAIDDEEDDEEDEEEDVGSVVDTTDNRTFNDDSMDVDDTNAYSIGLSARVNGTVEDIGEDIGHLDDEISVNLEDGLFDELAVPKFKDEELNSDEDYEIDDNELLATLQADNDDFMTLGDDEIAGMGGSGRGTRNNSLGSIEDDENDPFLKEEEKFLVNEFENNGFDEEDRNSLMDTFNQIHNDNKAEVIQYASSSSEYGEFDDEDEDEGDFEVIDFKSDSEDDSNEPIFKRPNGNKKSKSKRRLSKKHRGIAITNSDEEDDLYLWNYFFSSDESSDEIKLDAATTSAMDGYVDGYYGDYVDDLDEQVIVEELFKQIDKEDKSRRAKEAAAMAVATATVGGSGAVNNSKMFSIDQEMGSDALEVEYDSGESTDVDLSLPTLNKIKSGSKMAKEVLSSRTADYRPPVLGTWVALDSKPFGIIDGLSTRSLQTGVGGVNGAGVSGAGTGTGADTPRAISRRITGASRKLSIKGSLSSSSSSSSVSSVSSGNIKGLSSNKGLRASVGGRLLTGAEEDEDALGLDELLNVSELDDQDENDIRIWQDFNAQKKRVPLGAFRNKSLLHQNQNMIHIPAASYGHTSKSNNEFNQRRYSLTNTGAGGRIKKSISEPTQQQTQNRKSSIGGGSGRRRSSTLSNTGSVSNKQKRRRASIIEAVSEGFRPTKSGLFSENALADVEEVLGDDRDIMALIKGL